MSTHDEALVTELAELAAESLGWDWPEHPSGPDAIRPEVEAILDRLVELGWRENCGVVTRGGHAAICALPRGHREPRHADGGGVAWGACDLDRRADGIKP